MIIFVHQFYFSQIKLRLSAESTVVYATKFVKKELMLKQMKSFANADHRILQPAITDHVLKVLSVVKAVF